MIKYRSIFRLVIKCLLVARKENLTGFSTGLTGRSKNLDPTGNLTGRSTRPVSISAAVNLFTWGFLMVFTKVINTISRYPYTSQKNISPKIICQKNISLNFLFPELTFVRNHTCQNEHLPEITSARMNIWLKLHLPEWALVWNYICQNEHLPECTFARMYIWPKVHFPENLFSRIYTCQNVHLAEITFPRKLIFQNLHLPECTFGRNYISPKTYFPEFTLARMYIWPKLHFPENLFSRI